MNLFHKGALVGSSLLVGLLMTGQGVLAAGGSSEVVYNSIPHALPGNVYSDGFEATSTSELGSEVQLARERSQLQSVSVVMSSWACESGTWTTGDCLTTPGATFTVPLTLSLYRVDTSTSPQSAGALLLSRTQSFVIAYRPSSTPGQCATSGDPQNTWFDAADGACYHGLTQTVTW